MSVTDNINKLLKGTNDEKIKIIEELTRSRLLVLLGLDGNVPLKMEYIVTDVSIKRFNRISNEGMKSYEQEGLRITFPDSDFDEFLDDIAAFKAEKDKEDNPTLGVFKFL